MNGLTLLHHCDLLVECVAPPSAGTLFGTGFIRRERVEELCGICRDEVCGAHHFPLPLSSALEVASLILTWFSLLIFPFFEQLRI